MKEIDLPPTEWTSEREKPAEPFFGPGWPIGLSAIASIVLAAIFHEGGLYVVGAILGVVVAGIIAQVYR